MLISLYPKVAEHTSRIWALLFFELFMQFNELEENIVTLPKYKNTFIYFLLLDNEVIYVGQTKNGIIRPLSHRDKEFDTVKILYCEEYELDELEDKFIMKYKPKFNKECNHILRYSVSKSRNLIRAKYNDKNFTLRHLRKLINMLDIPTDFFNGVETIKITDFELICEEIENGYAK